MSKVLIEESTLTAIGDSIRGKTGKSDKLPPQNMSAEIDSIQTKPETVDQATPSISVSSAGLITASATQTEGYVEAGTKSATKQLTVQAAKTVTPSSSAQTAVASGRYTTGAIKVAAIPSTYKQVAFGTFTRANYVDPVSVTGLGFTPSTVIGYKTGSGSVPSYESLIYFEFGDREEAIFQSNKGGSRSSYPSHVTVTMSSGGFTVTTDTDDGWYMLNGTWNYIAIE